MITRMKYEIQRTLPILEIVQVALKVQASSSPGEFLQSSKSKARLVDHRGLIPLYSVQSRIIKQIFSGVLVS